MHPDGSGLQRIIGDSYKSRLPAFSSASSRLAFYSNRGGKYEIWSIAVNGSQLAQETNFPGVLVNTPVWSPNGRMLACRVGGNEALIDLAQPLDKRSPEFLPYAAVSSSPDDHVLYLARTLAEGHIWLLRS